MDVLATTKSIREPWSDDQQVGTSEARAEARRESIHESLATSEGDALKSLMKTIARIRDGSGNEPSNQSIGFDAVAKKIDSITSNVNRKALRSNLRNATKQHGDKPMYSMKPSIPTKPSSMRSYGRPEI